MEMVSWAIQHAIRSTTMVSLRQRTCTSKEIFYKKLLQFFK